MYLHRPSRPRLSPTRTLLPGDIYCDRSPQCFGTVLGSCVSVCLWDSQLRFGGMNHFILPNRPAEGEASPRFGDVAIPQLVNAMVGLGSNIRHLRAKIFGGGYVLRAGDPALSTGRRNVAVAVSELRRLRIPIVASRLSGTQGLVIRQCTDCGDVWVRPTGVIDRKLEPATNVEDLSCFAEDVTIPMTADGEDSVPLAIHTRSPAGAARWCETCTSSPLGWRRA